MKDTYWMTHWMRGNNKESNLIYNEGYPIQLIGFLIIMRGNNKDKNLPLPLPNKGTYW